MQRQDLNLRPPGDEPVGHILIKEGHGQAQVLFQHQLLEVHLRLAGGDAPEDLSDGCLQGAEEHAAHHEEDGPHAHVAGHDLGGGVGDDEAQLGSEEGNQGSHAHPEPGHLDAGHQNPEGFPDAGLFFCSCWFYIVRHEKTSQSCYFAQIGPHKQRLGCIQSHSKAAAAPRQCALRIPQVWLSMLRIFRNILQFDPQAQNHNAQIAKNPCISYFNVV